MKSGRKRVKQFLDEGFYFGTKSSNCCIPVLNYERVDLLLACLVFKTLLLCYLSVEVALLFCTATFYREAFQRVCVLGSWSKSIHSQFKSHLKDRQKVFLRWVVKMHSGSLLHQLYKIQFTSKPLLLLYIWQKKKNIPSLSWIGCIGTVLVLISDWKNRLSCIAFKFYGFVFF